MSIPKTLTRRTISAVLCTAMVGAMSLIVAGSGGAGAATTLPIVQTNAALSASSTTSVTLSGLVNPNGLDTQYWFIYGSLTAAGNSTPQLTATADAGSGTTAAVQNMTLSGLIPGTTYQFEIAAISAAGTSYGNFVNFTTSAPVVATDGVSTLNSAGATLTGSVNPNGTDASYYFQFGTSTAYGDTTPTLDGGAGIIPIEQAATISGLSLGTTYDYRLVATNAFGTTYGANQTFLATVGSSQFVVGQILTSSTLKLRKASVQYGKETQERLNVSVSALANVPPTGQVRMIAGTKALCTITLVGSRGSCVLTARKLHVGTYTIVASYLGGTTFFGSMSNQETLRIHR